MTMKETALKILRSFGLDREVGLYLNLFLKLPPHKFAVIKISGETLANRMPILAQDLAFLSKLGLHPIVIHGGGKQIDEELLKKGIRIRKMAGLRISDEATMKVVARTMNELTDKLVKSINKSHGGRAINTNSFGIVRAGKRPKVDGIDLGFVGEVKSLDVTMLKQLCSAGYLPVIASLGYENNQAYNINADTLASNLVKKLKPKKLILITESGGVLDKNGQILSTIDVQTDLPRLIDDRVITEGMLLKVQEIKSLLEECPGTIVEICSAENVLRELFTVKGSGTFIRYGGIFKFTRSFAGLNQKKIEELLEESFGKTLVDDYFDDEPDGVIVDNDYSCIAIIKKVDGVPYLDKFAIAPTARGNGLANLLWHSIKKHYSSLIWRASINNSINSWYFRNCDGVQKHEEWIVFWYNINHMKAAAMAKGIAKMPKSMVFSKAIK